MGYANPLLKLPAAQKLLALPPNQRQVIEALMRELRADADQLAEQSWKKRKGPMAAYWRAVATYSRHIAHALSKGLSRTRSGDVAIRCLGHEWVNREAGQPWLICSECGALYENVPEAER